MRLTRALVSLVVAALLLGSPPARAGDEALIEAFEAGPGDGPRLPRGKEADGILGDFVLRNGFVEALISGNLPGRKANMTTHYTAEAIGCLFDLSVAGSDNDQLTLFAPGSLQGQVSSVSLEPPPADAPTSVVVERTAARGKGLEERHRYFLAPGWRHLLVVSEYAVLRGADWKIKPEPFVKGLRDVRAHAGISFGEAMNPTDQQGYAWAPVAHAVRAEPDWDPFTLRSGERKVVAAAVAPGRSPAEAFGAIAALRGSTGELTARLHEKGRGIRTARLSIWLDEKTAIPAYPDRRGAIAIRLLPGTYRWAAADLGRPAVEGKVEVREAAAAALDIEMRPASKLAFEVTDAAVPGKKCPCKVQIIGLGLTQDPDLGVGLQAHGGRNQYQAENGWFDVAVPPGDYRLVITHGIEFSHVEKEVRVEPEKTVVVAAELKRVVDTRGAVSVDFHSHSTPSGDNYCGTDDRLINHAAENVEFAATTEHNRFYDWGPHIRKLGIADELATAVGIELTGSGAHLNAFPFRATPWAQDGGAPTWVKDPRLNAITLRDFQGGGPERYVQINHPHVGEFFRDRDADGVPDGGYSGLEGLLDAAEVWSTEILNPQLWLVYKDASTGRERPYQNRTFAWLQLLNQGRYLVCVAVSDAHSVFEDGAGGWRTYVPSSTDEPARIDPKEVVRNAKAGRMMVTNGPYLEVKLDDGTLPGGLVRRAGGVEVDVRVQATTWIDIDRVQVLVNGRQPQSLNFTREKDPELFAPGVIKFEKRIAVPLAEDAHLIVAAVGEKLTLAKGYGGSRHAAMRPVAFSNPIFVDVNGGGFEPNGDTLGQPLPTGVK